VLPRRSVRFGFVQTAAACLLLPTKKAKHGTAAFHFFVPLFCGIGAIAKRKFTKTS